MALPAPAHRSAGGHSLIQTARGPRALDRIYFARLVRQDPEPEQISGASHDRGGGCVAAVEVSVDGGATWHPVEGREAWRYEWKPEGSGTRTIVCRAVDDSGNLEVPAAGVTVTVSEMD